MNVTVIIPVYNAENYILKAVQSALFHKQVTEIIIVEDGSTDNSLAICEKLQAEHSIVKLYQHPNGINKGASESRNLGIFHSTQEYISFLDADDFMTEIRFEREMELFEEIKDVDGVYGAMGVMCYDKIGAKAWKNKGFKEFQIDSVNKVISPDDLFDFLIAYKNKDNYSGYFTIDAMTLKRSSLINHNILFDNNLRLHQDTAFIFKCAYYLKLVTGEFRKPISIRGVHRNNRYINNKERRKSKLRLYESLISWAVSSKLEKKYQDVFRRSYFISYFEGFKTIQFLFLSIQTLIYDPYFKSNLLAKIRNNKFTKFFN